MCVWLDMMIFFRGSRSGSIFIKAARADGLTSWSDTRGRWVQAPFCPEGLRNRRKPEKPCARNPRIIRPEGWRLSGDSEEFLARGGVREDLARIIFGVVRSGKYHSRPMSGLDGSRHRSRGSSSRGAGSCRRKGAERTEQPGSLGKDLVRNQDGALPGGTRSIPEAAIEGGRPCDGRDSLNETIQTVVPNGRSFLFRKLGTLNRRRRHEDPGGREGSPAGSGPPASGMTRDNRERPSMK